MLKREICPLTENQEKFYTVLVSEQDGEEVSGRVRINEYDGFESVEEEGEFSDWLQKCSREGMTNNMWREFMTGDTVLDRYVDKVIGLFISSNQFVNKVREVVDKHLEKVQVPEDYLVKDDLDDYVTVDDLNDYVTEDDVSDLIDSAMDAEIDRRDLVDSDMVSDIAIDTVSDHVDNEIRDRNLCDVGDVQEAVKNMDPDELCVVQEVKDRLDHLEEAFELLDELQEHPAFEKMLAEVRETRQKRLDTAGKTEDGETT